MPLSPGARLGPYEITGPLGAGGMGQVYRALDTTLGRQVAIKILPDTFASDPERLARLEREARTLASLNHPHIAAIYGFERSGGVHALVMELVEGDDLSLRLVRGPLPVEDVLTLGKQIAEALEAAHDQGIVHRDLKPANIKVREDGTVKVLDFGLAKLVERDDASRSGGIEALSQSPTVLSPAITQMGLILGTAAYMSPEQAKGKPADRRSDIWAFGCVLFEMLTGRRAFEGEDVSETLASLLKQDVDWSALPISTPPAIRTLLRRCLQKNPKRRWQSAADVRIEIEEAMNAPATASTTASPPGRVGWRWMAMAAVAVLIAGALGTIAGWSLRRPTESRRVARVVVGIAPAAQIPTQGAPTGLPLRTAFALSPDGASLVFLGVQDGTRRLYLRRLDSLVATPIAGTDDGDSPFFSPDGLWIGFWQGDYTFGAPGALKKAPIAGGPALVLCETARPTGASWGADGQIVYADGSLGALWRVPDAGGKPEPLTTLDPAAEVSHRLPQVLPNGRGVLFTVLKSTRGWDEAQTVVRTTGGERKVLLTGAVDARYVSTGHLVYARNGTLMAVPFDLERLQVSGDPAALLEGVIQDVNSYSASGRSGAAQFAVGLDGTLAYVPGPISSGTPGTPVWLDRRGVVEPLDVKPEAATVRLSPDGQQILFEGETASVYDLTRGILSRPGIEGRAAIWHPDGRRLTFASRGTGPGNLFWMPVDRSGPAERLTTSDRNQAPVSWAPDGKTLAFSQFESPTNRDIWILSLATGTAEVRPFLTTPSDEQWSDFSPDGRFLAYVTNDGGREEVYVQPYPGPGQRVQVSNNGGMQPAWASNGRELFYTEGTGPGAIRMMAVDVTLSDRFTAGRPRLLFEARLNVTVPLRSYDVTRDGSRFITNMRDDTKPAAPITGIVLVQNWFEELRRLAPGR